MDIYKYGKLVTSFGLSKRLKDAGYPQKDALFYWVIKTNEKIGDFGESLITEDFAKQIKSKLIAAPTLSEILDDLCRKKSLSIFEGAIYCEPSAPFVIVAGHSSSDRELNALAEYWISIYGKKDET